MSDIKYKIDIYLKQNNMTLVDLATLSGIPLGTLRGMLYDKSDTRISNIRALVQAMQCSYDYLLDDTDSIAKDRDRWFNKYNALPPALKNIVDNILDQS